MNPYLKSGFVVLVLALGIWGFWVNYEKDLKLSEKAPPAVKIINQMEKEGMVDFEAQDLQGETFKLSDYKGQVVVINFWASWCAPCVEEFPSLIEMLEHFKGQVKLIAVSNDHNEEDMKTFIKAIQAESPHLRVVWDKGRTLAEKYGLQALPETFIVAKDFTLVRKISGDEDWASPQALRFFESLVQ